MLKMFVDEKELEPVGLGAQIGQMDDKKALFITFKSGESLDGALKVFKDMTSDSAVILKNEKREMRYEGYTALDNEVTTCGNGDGTYTYSVRLKEPDALEIAKQATADAAYIAVMAGVEL